MINQKIVIIRFAFGDILRRFVVSWADIFCHISRGFSVLGPNLVTEFDLMDAKMSAIAGFFLKRDDICRIQKPLQQWTFTKSARLHWTHLHSISFSTALC